jgi:endonuclease/exonuclease/phosphatase family metal-dependent hydrolase
MEKIHSPYFTKKKDIISKRGEYSKFPQFNLPIAYTGEQNLHYLFSNYNDAPDMSWPINKFCAADLDVTKESISDKKSDVIRVMTYNVHNWVEPCIIKKVDGSIVYDKSRKINKKDHVRTIKMVTDVIKPDIALLQEIVPIFQFKHGVEQAPQTDEDIEKGSIVPIFEEFVKKGYVYNDIVDAHYIENSMDYYYFLGNGILSKIPNKSSFKYIKLGHNRMAMCTNMEIFGHNIVIICVHTSVVASEMKDNMAELNKIIDMMYQKNKLLVLGGDFNQNLHRFTDQKLDHMTFISDDENSPGVTSMNGEHPIDHILVTPEFKELFDIVEYKSIPSNMSDHNPVIMDFKIKNRSVTTYASVNQNGYGKNYKNNTYSNLENWYGELMEHIRL